MTSTVRAVDPGIPAHEVGVVQAEQDDHHAAIVGATLQTLRSARRLKAVGRRDVILWDEVHHAAADGFHTTFNDLGGQVRRGRADVRLHRHHAPHGARAHRAGRRDREDQLQQRPEVGH